MQEKLYRNKNDKIILGVCGGIANYFNIDSTIVRIFTAIVLLIASTFILSLYLILAIVMPENPNEKKIKKIKSIKNNKALGAGFLIIGITLLLDSYNIISWRNMWPVILIFLGVFILWGKQIQKK